MRNIRLPAYAKINLSIDVLGRRPDGYHTVEMVMHQIRLADLVTVAVAPGSGEIRVDCDRADVPRDLDNLAGRAAALYLERFADRFPEGAAYDVSIRIEKKIPMAAGLAGGSADAAAALRGLDQLLGRPAGEAALLALAAELGADVPFCVMGQAGTPCALAAGIGTDLTPLPPLPAFLVLATPPLALPTAAVYQALDPAAAGPRPDTAALVAGLAAADFRSVAGAMENRLTAPAVRLWPTIGALQQRMEAAAAGSKGPVRVQMSGSGPTVFALCQDRPDAEAIHAALREEEASIFLTETLPASPGGLSDATDLW